MFICFEEKGILQRPKYSDEIQHNGHLYYIILNDEETRIRVQSELAAKNIFTAPHYISLHSSPAGIRFGKAGSTMNITNDYPKRLLRLPMHQTLTFKQIEKVIEALSLSLGLTINL